MDMFTALAEPTRRSIVEMLADNGRLSATDICNRFSSSPPAISQHLKVLREARLVRVEKQAQQRIYSINPDGINELENWVQQTKQLWTARFNALDVLLEKEVKKSKVSKKASKK